MSDLNAADLDAAMPVDGSWATTRNILSEVCTPWCIFVIGNLDGGPMRFTELKRAVNGISQRMLAVSLRALEREGLVLRTVDAGKPIKVTYALTVRGKGFASPAKALINWAAEHQQSASAVVKELRASKQPGAIAQLGLAESGLQPGRT